MRQIFKFFICIACLSGQAQEFVLDPIAGEPLEADHFIGVDNYGNTYYTKDRALYKKDNHTQYQFSALSLGELTTVDIINPLKLTLFYQKANVAVILDNTLNEITRIDFNAIEDFRNVSHATTASDRRLWIFNTDLQQLELFDYTLFKVVTQFQPLSSLASAQSSNFNFCYLLVENMLYSYNNYGTFLAKQDIPSLTKLKQYNDDLIGLAQEGLYFKSSQEQQFYPILLHKNDIQDFHLIDEILYIYNGQQLTAYRLKPTKK